MIRIRILPRDHRAGRRRPRKEDGEQGRGGAQWLRASGDGRGVPSRAVRSEPRRDGGGTDDSRGPEVESWFGADEGSDPALENEWPLLPFMALSDGAHAYVPLLSRGDGEGG